ncbi:hypothetical protein [Candidatus Pelagibacter sp.]|uniref:hypothetical protein n=1 Tax=Candidatus Pelagibacter sp. TaxID=2024849 RepID=UPI003F82C20E
MNLEKTFKKVILIQVATLVGGIIAAFYPSESVEKANEFLDQSNWYADNEGSYLVLISIFLILVLIYLYSLYAIYNFKKKGRNIFLYSLILLTISNLFAGEYAYSVFDIFFLDISSMLSGAILIFIYFTNLNKKFR